LVKQSVCISVVLLGNHSDIPAINDRFAVAISTCNNELVEFVNTKRSLNQILITGKCRGIVKPSGSGK
jgi:hypothetical protein